MEGFNGLPSPPPGVPKLCPSVLLCLFLREEAGTDVVPHRPFRSPGRLCVSPALRHLPISTLRYPWASCPCTLVDRDLRVLFHARRPVVEHLPFGRSAGGGPEPTAHGGSTNGAVPGASSW